MISVKRCQRTVACAALALLGTGLFAAPAQADDIRAQEWFLDRLHALQAWPVSQGAGVTVAVIDSGVEASHPDLRGQVLRGADLLTDNSSPNGWVDTDTAFNGHGTAMASLIAGTGASGGGHGMLGLAPRAKILPIHADLGNHAQPQAIAQGIRYAVANGATVVNLSIAGGAEDPGVRQAVLDAEQHNVLLVAGMGNAGETTNMRSFPAGYPGVVAVAATDQSDKPAGFSSFGSNVTLAAPGSQIVTAASHAGYQRGGGTSDSTALVSAAAALVRSHFPNLTAGQVINRLIQTADHPAGGRDQHVGYGIVNPYQALTADVPAGPTGNPLLDTPSSQPTITLTAHTTPSANATTSPASKGDDILLIAGITAAVLVVLATVVTLLLGVRRRRRSRPH